MKMIDVDILRKTIIAFATGTHCDYISVENLMMLLSQADTVDAVPINGDFGLMMTCAVRYTYGRRTYMPHAAIDYIKPLISHLDDRTLEVFDHDLNEAEHIGKLGDPQIDEPKWKEFHYWIRQELLRRGRDANRSWRDNNV